jgi:hypothetical protein
MQTQGTVVMAVYDDLQQAERAIDELRRFDFREEQIGLVVCGEPVPLSDAEPPPHPAPAPSPPEVGAMLGGVVGALAAVGLPGVGTVLAGGILAGLLEGAAAGGLVGVLVKLGVPEARAQAYGDAVELGRVLVVVHAEDRVEEADDILQAYRPYQVERRERAQPPSCD